jgi:hypothetical protein
MPQPWIFPTRTIALRLFLTCWIIFAIHLATNTVREIYLALAIGDHLSFRVDDYANMHPDLFEKKGYGWHIGANPGASMIGAIPYALTRPLIDRVVTKVNQARASSGLKEPPTYNSPWPMSREFYQEAWKRGYDIKFGLASVVMQALCMAPISALGVVAMFYLLRQVFASDRTAFWLALLYAFGTPVFFRTGFLNHNLMMGHFTLMGFLAMWNPSGSSRWSPGLRCFIGGLAGGAALLLDYSGIVLLGALFVYAIARYPAAWWFTSARNYVLGAVGPILLLWLYQYESFGNPFFPGQHWMPPVEWIDVGYQGFTFPQADLLRILLFDYRFGLFTTCPLMLLGLAAAWFNTNKLNKGRIPKREFLLISLVPLGLWLFCGGVSYVRLQYNNGLRYLAPLLPYLFISTVLVLARMPRRWAYLLTMLAVGQAWSMAMYRDVERGFGVLDPIVHVFVGGFQLPTLTVISRMKDQFGEYVAGGVSPLPIFALAAAVIWVIWQRQPASLKGKTDSERTEFIAVGR